MMTDVNELRDRAARWRQIARRITDERAIQALNDTAAELVERADRLEREWALTSAALAPTGAIAKFTPGVMRPGPASHGHASSVETGPPSGRAHDP
jgi:hypothetical protein